jgi:YHS domain-containing protein
VARIVLLLVLAVIVARIFSRIALAFREGMQQGAHGPSRVPVDGVQMVRDPVCGTFVLPERAVTLVHGRTRLYFCSDACRDKYRGERESVEGRSTREHTDSFSADRTA